ncbi:MULTISPECIES: hypothetical protein [Bacillus cereus group]|uniref:Uncharacterized protein n=1 Tax=Bacillus cereus TaxID=1396 RepID=A0A9W7QGK8_BACCE|nr:hypothetical protein [Bacillus cereus]KAB2393348.1 hypothetical protein F8172_17485 [Bacillus cereus]KAB2410724.1 hypothetical protein F8170_01230 [Bacillus cereus]KAB2430905.1 hypothetical protein F8168_06585 [Bacillus cereus]
MYNEFVQYPYVNYNSHMNYSFQNVNHDNFEDVRSLTIDDIYYRPDDAVDAPTTAPPSYIPDESSDQSQQYGYSVQGNYYQDPKEALARCLHSWGFLRLRRGEYSPFGRRFWFYPISIRNRGVTGYVWIQGGIRKASFSYNQIRRFTCGG